MKLSTEEEKLYQEILAYRRKNRLPPFALSKALTSVAKSHVEDLGVTESTRNSNCNMHSWGEDSRWKSCCYTNDHAQASCMWKKPKEMTSYSGTGYEISHGGSGSVIATTESALGDGRKMRSTTR